MYISETTGGADQVELAALNFQRRFHISADEVDANQRNSVSLSQASDTVDSPSSSRRESSSVSSAYFLNVHVQLSNIKIM